MAGKVNYINPDGLPKSPSYTQVVTVEGNAKTIYIGGQNGVDAGGQVVAKDDIAAQARQVYKNLETALAAASAALEDIIKWNVNVVHGHDPHPAFAVFQEVWNGRPDPPIISVLFVSALFVSALAHPDWLIEIDAVAVV